MDRPRMLQLYFGKRLFKTAIAVFITAEICHLLNWPMIFAVISAIVSIEPTVDASIRKGAIRLPSAAIGAAFAMIFDALLGSSPLTYTLSALFTIYVCTLLKWNQALIVATLTAVNMISVTHAHFLIEFLVRLGTTMTGIVVSAVINYFLFRPDYSSELKDLLNKAYPSILSQARSVLDTPMVAQQSAITNHSLDKIQSLLEFQTTDYRFKHSTFTDLREIVQIRQSLRIARRVQFYMETAVTSRDNEERVQCRQLLSGSVERLDSIFRTLFRPMPDRSHRYISGKPFDSSM